MTALLLALERARHPMTAGGGRHLELAQSTPALPVCHCLVPLRTTTSSQPPHPATPAPLYLPACREPQFSNAERSCLWELTSLAAHVHPSGKQASQPASRFSECGVTLLWLHCCQAFLSASAPLMPCSATLPACSGGHGTHAAGGAECDVRWRPAQGLDPGSLLGEVCAEEGKGRFGLARGCFLGWGVG